MSWATADNDLPDCRKIFRFQRKSLMRFLTVAEYPHDQRDQVVERQVDDAVKIHHRKILSTSSKRMECKACR